MTDRLQRLVFGEVAESYDAMRAGYPAGLVAAVTGYTGPLSRIVEIGAGTGKATAAFAPLGTPMTCVEPDPAMAAVLRRTVAPFPHVEVAESGFEEWAAAAPVGSASLVMCAQAWHWLDPQLRRPLTHQLLEPGGTVAIFGHQYGFDDDEMDRALIAAYVAEAPELADDPAARPAGPGGDSDVATSPLFTDVRLLTFTHVKMYTTEEYLRLLSTFSPHRMLASDRRDALFTAIADVVDDRGGVLRQSLLTSVVLARRA